MKVEMIQNFVLTFLLLGMLCNPASSQTKQDEIDDVKNANVVSQQEAEIRSLIDQLAVKKGGNPATCKAAFYRLMKFKKLAFPILVEHLEDACESIHFRNHVTGKTVGDACYWNIYFQLLDTPADYSVYGLSRKGKNLESHTKPRWDGVPFEGGLEKWLESCKRLTYEEMQIKGLTWMLTKEMKIGAPDADSYFLNIHPLQIRIMELKLDYGEDVGAKLRELRRIRDQRLAEKIPSELLPTKK